MSFTVWPTSRQRGPSSRRNDSTLKTLQTICIQQAWLFPRAFSRYVSATYGSARQQEEDKVSCSLLLSDTLTSKEIFLVIRNLRLKSLPKRRRGNLADKYQVLPQNNSWVITPLMLVVCQVPILTKQSTFSALYQTVCTSCCWLFLQTRGNQLLRIPNFPNF